MAEVSGAPTLDGGSSTTSTPVAVRPGQVVPSNRWDLLEVPDIGAWTPTLRVSLVLPYYQAPDALDITLAAIAEQTYPRELIQVVVADDGSEPPLELPADRDGLDVTVVHQEDRGFGLARARNTGAAAADGEVLIFLDCDMVPEPWHVEAHMRWHHACDDAVTLGFRRHVEFDDIGPEQVREAARAGELAPLFADRDQDVPAWLEAHMTRTAELTGPHDEIFRVVTGGNLGVRAAAYRRVGGSDESFTQWGSEDTELGYRLFVDGAVLVPERAALCWHQGAGHTLEDHELESLGQQRAKLSQLVAHPDFRPVGPGRSFVVPRVVVEVEGDGATGEQIRSTVESVLASELYDLHVELSIPDAHVERIRLSRDLGRDPRVTVERDPPRGPVPFVLHLPAGALVEPATIGTLVTSMRDAHAPSGLLWFEIEDRSFVRHPGLMATTRAISRAQRAAGDRPALEVAAELFGRRDVDAEELGLGWEEPAEPEAASPDAGGDELAFEEIQDLWDRLRGLDTRQRANVLALAEAVFDLSPRQRGLLVTLGGRAMSAGRRLDALRRAPAVTGGRKLAARFAVLVLPHRTVQRLRKRVYARAARRGGGTA